MIIRTYCGYINELEKVKKSASGGLATALSEHMVELGNVVYGAAYTCGYTNAKYIRVDSLDGIELLKGSKYIKASIDLSILENIADDLNNGNSVLFIGLPCDVFVVKSYMERNEIDDTNLVCVDLICHGPISPEVARQYVEKMEKKHKSKLVDFSVRYKNPYWRPPYLYAKFEDGTEYIKKFYKTEYGIAFLLMPGKHCYDCKFKGDNYKSDITIGDYWGVQPEDKGYNKYGTSIAFVHTDKGEISIKALTNFVLHEAETGKAIKGNPIYLRPVRITKNAEKFRKRFENKGLYYASRMYFGRYVPERVKNASRRIKTIVQNTIHK